MAGERRWQCPACGAGGDERDARWCGRCGTRLPRHEPGPHRRDATRLRRGHGRRRTTVALLAVVAVGATVALTTRTAPPGPVSTPVDLPDRADVTEPTSPVGATLLADGLPAGLAAPPPATPGPDLTCPDADAPCVTWEHRFTDGRADTDRTFVAITDDLVLVHEHTRLSALEPTTGRPVWEHEIDVDRNVTGRRPWVLEEVGLVLVVSSVAAGTPTPAIRAHRLHDGQLLWVDDGPARVRAAWVHDDHVRLVEDGGRRVRTIEPTTGVQTWEHADRAAGDEHGEVLLRDGQLTHRPADRDDDGWSIMLDDLPADGHLALDGLALTADLVHVHDRRGARWFDRANGSEVARWTDPRHADDPPPLAGDVAWSLPNGSAVALHHVGDGRRRLTVHRLGEPILEEAVPADVVPQLAVVGRVLAVAGHGREVDPELMTIDLVTGRLTVVPDRGGMLGGGEHIPGMTPDRGRATTGRNTVLASGQDGTWAVVATSGRDRWRVDGPVELVAGDDGLVVWPGGVLRVEDRA